MTIQQAIEKAIEGGYDGEVIYGSKAVNILARVSRTKSLTSNIYLYRVLLDPLFWQSLGKAMGWGNFEGKMDMHKNPITKEETQYFVDKLWKEEWHRFIDHLVEGKEAESFFEKL